MCNILEVADAAEVIVNGYAFTKAGENVKVLNLNKPEKAAYLNQVGLNEQAAREIYLKAFQGALENENGNGT